MTTPTSTISGLISGMDTNSIITQLMAIEKKPLAQLQAQVDTANQQKAAFTSINTTLLALKTSVGVLASPDSWSAKTTSVSDSSAVSATASGLTPAGNYIFNITQLAAASQLSSSGFADSGTTAVGAGTFDITVGSNTKTITVSAAGTLSDVAKAINNQDMGVSAAVVNTGQGATPYKLMLTSSQTGVANATSISNNTIAGLSFTTLTTAKNAVIEYGADSPIQFESATNSVTGMAPGLTLNLTGKSTGPVTVTVGADSAGILQEAKDFVTKYNAAVNSIDSNTSYNVDTKKAAPLFGNSTLRSLQTDLGVAISSVVKGQPAETSSLIMVGFDLGQDGTLSLDESAFSAALDAHPDGVAGLFSAITNTALASNGATISTGAVADSGFNVADLISGNTSSNDFGSGSGFQTATLPASFTVNFGQTSQISQLILNTINSAAMPSSTFGARDFSFELQQPGGSWTTVKSVTGFTGSDFYYNLDNAMTATALRVNVTATNAADGEIRLLGISANDENGVAKQLSNMLGFVTDSTSGEIATEESSLDTKIANLNKAMEDMQARLDAKQAQLQREFTNMESAMARMQSQSQSFLAQLGSTSSSS